MNLSKPEVKSYLDELKKSVRCGWFRLAPRYKNEQIFVQYIFSEDDMKEIILGLQVEDFCEAVYNDHHDYKDEILYIFGKSIRLVSKFDSKEEEISLYIKLNKLSNMYVIVISFHIQEHPLTYRFKGN